MRCVRRCRQGRNSRREGAEAPTPPEGSPVLTLIWLALVVVTLAMIGAGLWIRTIINDE